MPSRDPVKAVSNLLGNRQARKIAVFGIVLRAMIEILNGNMLQCFEKQSVRVLIVSFFCSLKNVNVPLIKSALFVRFNLNSTLYVQFIRNIRLS